MVGVIVSLEEDTDKHAEQTVLQGSKMAELINKLNTQKENKRQNKREQNLDSLIAHFTNKKII